VFTRSRQQSLFWASSHSINIIWVYSLRYTVTSLMELSRSWVAVNCASTQEIIPEFYGTQRFITVFTRALQRSLSWARSIQSVPSHPTCLTGKHIRIVYNNINRRNMMNIKTRKLRRKRRMKVEKKDQVEEEGMQNNMKATRSKTRNLQLDVRPSSWSPLRSLGYVLTIFCAVSASSWCCPGRDRRDARGTAACETVRQPRRYVTCSCVSKRHCTASYC
jgi:hypothetical protein